MFTQVHLVGETGKSIDELLEHEIASKFNFNRIYDLYSLHSLKDGILIIDSTDFFQAEKSSQGKALKGNPVIMFLDNIEEWDFLNGVQHVQGFLLEHEYRQLFDAIQAVNAGGLYFSVDLRKKIVNFIKDRYKDGTMKKIHSLTMMEKKVVMELLEDKSNKEIAETLFISKRTVEYYISSAICKWNVKSRVGLAIMAAKYFSLDWWNGNKKVALNTEDKFF